MSYLTQTFNNADDLDVAARVLLETHLAAGSVPVLLVSTAAVRARVRHAFADSPLAFGVRVETLDSWVADRWDLYGDGRRIVGAGERALLMQRACAEARPGQDCCSLSVTPGTIDVLARLAREALPWLLDAKDDLREWLSEAERGAACVLKRYAALLTERGLCESSQATALLPSLLEDVPPLVVAGIDETCWAYERMLNQLAERAEVHRLQDGCQAPTAGAARASELQALLTQVFRPVEEAPLSPSGAVRFLLPAGRYAAPPLILEAVCEAVAHECAFAQAEDRAAFPVAVVARNPRVLFDELADALAAHEVSCAVAAGRAFGDTAFGRVFLALTAFLNDDVYRVSQATDFALSPFSGMARRAACELDAAWRADRTIDRVRIVHDLSQASEAAAQVLEALLCGDVDAALAEFGERLRRRGDLDAAFRSEQLAAVAVAREFVDDCAATGTSFVEARPLLARRLVSASAQVDGLSGQSHHPAVEFLSLADAADRPPCSMATLVLCDLDAASYPVRAVEDPGVLLLEKLGLAQSCDPLAKARRQFFRALSTARDAVVCERVLNTVDADESYPGVMFEELIDCYRAPGNTPAASTEMDRATGLPRCLAPFARTAGEDALHENLTLTPECPPVDVPSGAALPWLAWELPQAGMVSPALRQCIVLPRSKAEGAPTLSPSAIESYLECPYKWFALRRLRLSEPDAGFGPLEMGSFSHGVLKSFYEHFIESGHIKVDADNLPKARELLRTTFARHLSQQPTLSPRRNPLVPRTPFEQAEVHDLEKKLVAYLDREAALLPGFAPTYFEFDFGSTEPFLYANCWLRGSVDRIDVNDRGQAVVIDYKGSLSADYALASCSPAAQAGGALLPHKVQALMYAQVVRRVLGLDVVGALYVSYGRDGRVAGAFDRTVISAHELGGIDAQTCGVPGPAGEVLEVQEFSQLLDAVEQRIACAIGSLIEGGIGPGPRGADPCGYCPVFTCERRHSA